jgi:chromosome segregation ATPase
MRQSSGGPAIAPPPPAPVLAPAGDNLFTIVTPRTPQDIVALRERREELSNQLESAADRRGEIAEEIKTAEGAARAGLEQRMSVLDQRILQLETDIAETGRQLTSAPAGLIAASQNPMTELGIDPHLVEKVSVLFTLFVLAPLAVGAAFLMFKRALRPATRPEAVSGPGNERMERLESAVDAIAVEIERISEGQRFVTRLLTEPSPQGTVGVRPGERARIGSRSEPG